MIDGTSYWIKGEEITTKTQVKFESGKEDGDALFKTMHVPFHGILFVLD